MAGLSKVLLTSPQCRKARQAFQAYMVLAPLTGILLFSQLMKVRKLWVRISKVPESPPNSSVTGTQTATEEASFEISQETVYFWLASEEKRQGKAVIGQLSS